jgi:hypothetical protein
MAKSITNNNFLSAYTKSQEDIYVNHQNLYSKLNYNSDDISLNREYSNNRQDKGVNIVDSFRVFHQNIRGLKSKIDELGLYLLDVTPHIIYLTEHHLKDHEIDIMSISQYKLGAKYCRLNLKYGGVSIYILDSLTYDNVNLITYSKEQDLEICAIKLRTQPKNIILLCI